MSFSSEIIAERVEDLLFLDETGFDLNIVPRQAFAPVGTFPTIEGPADKGINLSVVCIISFCGVLHYNVCDGAFNTKKLYQFLKECPKEKMAEKTLVMDNAKFHHGREVSSII